MPRRAKGQRLYLDTKRKQWVIRDGPNFVRSGAGEGERSAADKALAQYIAHKYRPEPSGVPMIGDVLAVYGAETAPHKKSARNIGCQIRNLLPFWGEKTVGSITAKSCRAFVGTKAKRAHRPI